MQGVGGPGESAGPFCNSRGVGEIVARRNQCVEEGDMERRSKEIVALNGEETRITEEL
jgi:hypothetical protein